MGHRLPVSVFMQNVWCSGTDIRLYFIQQMLLWLVFLQSSFIRTRQYVGQTIWSAISLYSGLLKSYCILNYSTY